MERRKRKKPMAEINVVPYIDVMLVLLVIFMITAPMLTQGVSVDLPKSKAQTVASEEQEPIILSVDSKGLYYLNVNSNPNQAMPPEMLAVRVSALLQIAKQSSEKRLVLVKGDKNVDYGKVVEAMALLQQAGAKSVGLLTEPPPNSTMASNTMSARS